MSDTARKICCSPDVLLLQSRLGIQSKELTDVDLASEHILPLWLTQSCQIRPNYPKT